MSTTLFNELVEKHAHRQSEALRQLRDLTAEVIAGGGTADESVIADLVASAGLSLAEFQSHYQHA